MRVLALAMVLTAGAAATPAAAAVHVFNAVLNGANEAPANASPGTGVVEVLFDDVAHTMTVDVEFSGLLGTVTAAHIHGPTAVAGDGTAGVATATPTFPGFPSGVTAGTYLQTFDMTLASSYRAGFLNDPLLGNGSTATAEQVLLNAMLDGKAYFNIHTNLFPGGEIRGFLAAVPEPGTWALMVAGFGMAGAALRRRAARPATGAARC